MFCQRCGGPVAPQAQFCPQCGAPRPMGYAVAPPTMERPGAITLLAVLDFVAAAVLMIAAAALLTMGTKGKGAIAAGAVFGFFVLLSIVTAVGLFGLKPWARTLQIVLSIFGLLVFPLGTIFSALVLSYLFRPGVKLLFSGRRIEELAPHEINALQNTRVGTGLLVGTAVVVFLSIPFLGIISAIAIPNFLTAIQRSRQKRTMADMRSIAVRIEQYRVDHGRFPDGETIDELRKNVGVTTPDGRDAWQTELRYETKGHSYWLVSAGNDKQFERPAEEYEAGKISNFNEDLVFKDGEFLRAP